MINMNIKNGGHSVPQYLTCEDCEYENTCSRYEECSFLLNHSHKNDSNTESLICNFKKETTSFTGGSFRTLREPSYDSLDTEKTLFSYHRDIVNDALKVIRKGGTAYVYTVQALKDVLKFEPKASVYIQDEIFYVNIGGVLD